MGLFSGFIRKKEIFGISIASFILLLTGALIDSDPIPENKWTMVTDSLIMIPIFFLICFFIYFSGKLVYSCFAGIINWVRRD